MKYPGIKKIVLAYSGGLDTSVILTWLKENSSAEIVAFSANIGQLEDMEAIRQKAFKTGAAEVYMDDLTEEYVRDFVWPMLRAGARYEDQYLLGTSIARPLIAKRHVEVARLTGADAVAHGATGKGNDQVRFELTFAALGPHLKVIAPWREWDLLSRDKLFDYAEKHNIPLPVTRDKPYSMDQNILHTSYEGGVLEDPRNGPDDSMFQMTVSPQSAPNEAQDIRLTYAGGDLVAIDGQSGTPALLLARANKLAGAHGIGRADIVENRFVGMKSRGVYETPGGTLVQFGRRAVEQLTLDREVMRLRDRLMPEYAELVYYGFWFAPEREALQGLFDSTSRNVNGEVVVRMYKGNMSLRSRESDQSLYRSDIASFDDGVAYNQADATGFIRLQGLRLRIGAALRAKRGG